MKRSAIIAAALAAVLGLASCGSQTEETTAPTETTEAVETTSESKDAEGSLNAVDGDDSENVGGTTEAQTESIFEEQVFECDSVKITVIGMQVITDGQNAGYVGANMFIEDKTENTLILPAFTECWAGSMLRYDDYPMGVKAGDEIILKLDGTGSFTHEWDIEDEAGNVVDHLSMQLTVPKELMDESIAQGISYVAEEPVAEEWNLTLMDNEYGKVVIDSVLYIEGNETATVTVTATSRYSSVLEINGTEVQPGAEITFTKECDVYDGDTLSSLKADEQDLEVLADIEGVDYGTVDVDTVLGGFKLFTGEKLMHFVVAFIDPNKAVTIDDKGDHTYDDVKYGVGVAGCNTLIGLTSRTVHEMTASETELLSMATEDGRLSLSTEK